MPALPDDTRNNFTALRLLLALAVVLGHFKSLPGNDHPIFPFNLADIAVYCFFVVSGFLIAGSYDRTSNVWSFFIRRFFRLYPMYLCIVLVQAAFMMALLPDGPFSEPASTLRYLVTNALLANFLQYDIGGVLAGLHNPGINPSLWTLKIEIGFYMIEPLIHGAVRRWGWSILATLFAGSAAYYLVALELGDVRMARQLPGQLQYFVLGMALYTYGGRLRAPRRLGVLLVSAILVAWAFNEPSIPAVEALVVSAFVYAFAFWIPAVPLRTDISYSVYLVHGPLLQTLLLLGLLHDNFLCLASILAAVIVMSIVFERLIERPGIALGHRLSRQVGRRRPAISPQFEAP